MSNNKKKTKEELKKLQEDLIRKQTDLAAFLSEQEILEAALETELEQELREDARHNLEAFFVQAWSQFESVEYIPNWHISCLCEHLQAVQTGEIENLIIQIPPRHCKSSLVSVVFPVWSWLQNPAEKFITAAAVDRLAIRDAVRSRRLLTSNWFQGFKPPFELQDDVNQKSRYENTLGGYRISTSVRSTVIGEGYSIFSCDDPVRPSDVTSKVELENVLDWWNNLMVTRRNKNGRRILLHQRLAVNDPIGWELQHNPGVWENICLPYEFEPERKFFSSLGWTDPRTKEGEILWPAKNTQKDLKMLKKALGVYGSAAQLQQNPVPLEGGIIKRDWIVKNHYNSQDQFNRFSLNQFDLIIGSWDLTFSNTGDSWNVGIVVGKKGSDKYILDMWRGRYDIIQQRDAIREMYAKYPQIRAMLIEKKANGEAVQRVLRREIPGILLIDPRDIGAGDKEARLSACAIDFEANNVKFPHPSLPGCSWVELAIDELTLFPKTPNDDIVDAVSMALNWLASKSNNRVTSLTNFFSNNNPQEKAKFEGKVAPSKEELNQDGSFLQIVENQVNIPTFNVSGLKSYKSIFN